MTTLTAAPEADWDAIVRQHGKAIYRYAYRLTGNRADAEDLAQETFVRVFQGLDRRGPAPIEAWIRRIAANLFLDQMRRRSRIRFDPLGEAAEQVVDPNSDPHGAYERRHFCGDVGQALARLPEEYRTPVLMNCVDGLSYEEVAQALQVKLGTVRSRIHRGRSQLRSAMAGAA
jgi:RNA polymerase sigma-70 factor (ECF subfamily)